MLGATTEFFDFPFVGSMDNVRFYNRTLTQQEVTELFNTDPLCIELGPPPVANFSVSSTEICRGKAVMFSDLSTNTPTAWAWQVTPPVGSSPAAVANPTFSFPTGGIYTITLVSTNSVGASNTASQVVFVSECTTISEIAGSEIRVFPNPVVDFLEIKSGVNLKTFSVTDISGKIIAVESQTILGSSKVDLRSLSSGLYFLILETNSGMQSLKILKE